MLWFCCLVLFVLDCKILQPDESRPNESPVLGPDTFQRLNHLWISNSSTLSKKPHPILFSCCLQAASFKKDVPMQITIQELLSVKLKKTESVGETKKVRPTLNAGIHDR